MPQHHFKTEVSRLLDLIIHSLYSHKEIFLRELVSNASDAIDKLRYLSVSDEAFKSIAFEPSIRVIIDKEAKTIVIEDNGIGMDEKELEDNLGTIARSGHSALSRQAPRRREERLQPHRSVRRRLLLGLHGRRQGRGDEPQGRRRGGLHLDERRQGRILDRGGLAGRSRHGSARPPQRRGPGILGPLERRVGAQEILESYRLSDLPRIRGA